MFLLATNPEHQELYKELDDYLTPAASEYANTWGALKGAFLTSKEMKLKKHCLVRVIMFGIVKEMQCNL